MHVIIITLVTGRVHLELQFETIKMYSATLVQRREYSQVASE